MGNDPISNMDPTGGEDNDWYKNTLTGQMFFDPDNHAPEEIVGCTVFQNVGASYIDAENNYGEDGSWGKAPWATPPSNEATISAAPPPTFWQQMENSNILNGIVYDVVNSFYVTTQNLGGKQVLGRSYAFALDGHITTPDENVTALATASSTFLSAPEEQTMFSEVPANRRLFWSGGDLASEAALKFMDENPEWSTIGQTRAGQYLLERIVAEDMSWEQQKPLWEYLSAEWARGTEGTAPFFDGGASVSPASIWINTERPILWDKGIEIIYMH